jgi:hypothetical protein
MTKATLTVEPDEFVIVIRGTKKSGLEATVTAIDLYQNGEPSSERRVHLIAVATASMVDIAQSYFQPPERYDS